MSGTVLWILWMLYHLGVNILARSVCTLIVLMISVSRRDQDSALSK
jgi:hypothetical protein